MRKFKKSKIGIIGCGNMGSVIAKRIASKYEVFIFDKEAGKTKNIAKGKVAKSISDLLNNVNVIILAVKPQDFDVVLNEIKNNIDDKLVISIAAGKTTKDIEKKLGRAKVIRTMPNLLIRVGKGVTALCKGEFATNNDLNFARQIFNCLGVTLVLEENMMNAVTAISGSGPGFQFALLSKEDKDSWEDFTKNQFIPALTASAEASGFSKQQSELLAKYTGEGGLVLLRESKESPNTLCIQVTSKKGTTEAGLKKLKGKIKFLPNAVKTAINRAKQLSSLPAGRQGDKKWKK